MPAPRLRRNGTGSAARLPPATSTGTLRASLERRDPSQSMPDSIEISCPPAISETGAFRISWDGSEGAIFELRENGEIIYQGGESATTVTGRPAGVYGYAVATAAVESEPCVVEVAPPSLGFAFTLFGIGFVVFVCTLVLILRGHRATRDEEGAA
jgi:hypothetical protein